MLIENSTVKFYNWESERESESLYIEFSIHEKKTDNAINAVNFSRNFILFGKRKGNQTHFILSSCTCIQMNCSLGCFAIRANVNEWISAAGKIFCSYCCRAKHVKCLSFVCANFLQMKIPYGNFETNFILIYHLDSRSFS